MKRLLFVPYTFVLLNWAAMMALYLFLRGRDLDRVWAGPRRVAAGGHGGVLRAAKP